MLLCYNNHVGNCAKNTSMQLNKIAPLKLRPYGAIQI